MTSSGPLRELHLLMFRQQSAVGRCETSFMGLLQVMAARDTFPILKG